NSRRACWPARSAGRLAACRGPWPYRSARQKIRQSCINRSRHSITETEPFGAPFVYIYRGVAHGRPDMAVGRRAVRHRDIRSRIPGQLSPLVPFVFGPQRHQVTTSSTSLGGRVRTRLHAPLSGPRLLVHLVVVAAVL